MFSFGQGFGAAALELCMQISFETKSFLISHFSCSLASVRISLKVARVSGTLSIQHDN